MLHFLALALASAQSSAEIPHPSHPVSAGDFQDVEEAVDMRHLRGREIWEVLDPSWLVRDEALLGDAERHAALAELARRRGADPATLRRWRMETRPRTVHLDVRLAAGDDDASFARQPVREGSPAVLGDRSVHRFLMDFDVEIASGAEIADPVHGLLHEGRSLAVELLPVPGIGWRAEFAWVHTVGERGEEVDLGYEQLAGKRRLRQALAECGTTALLRPGVAVELRLPDAGGQPTVLAVTARGETPPRTRTLAPDLHWLWLPSAAAEPGAWDAFLQRWSDDAAALPYAGGVLVMEGEGASARAATAAREVAAAVQPHAVRVRVHAQIPGEEARVTEFAVPCVAGRPVALAQGSLTDALADWDVEVAMVARVADPHFVRMFRGVSGEIALRPLADRVAEVRLDLRVRDGAPGEPRRIRVSAGSAGERSFEGDVPARPPQQMLVEPARLAEMRVQGTFETDAEGRLTIERSAAALYGEGARVTVTVDVERTP